MKMRKLPLMAALIAFLFPAVSDVPFLFRAAQESTRWRRLGGGLCEAAGNAELFSRDIGKQKEGLEIDFRKTEEALSSVKLQDARSILEVLDFKTAKIKKNVSKQEMEGFRRKIDGYRKSLSHLEDSLVATALGLLRTQGVDASLHYAQNDLRIHGVVDKKIEAVEKKILKDAPAIQISREREEIAQVVRILESGASPDASVNPYILKMAKLIIKSKADSAQKIEKVERFKEMEEAESVLRAKAELEQAINERKKVEERLAQKAREEEMARFAGRNSTIGRSESEGVESTTTGSPDNRASLASGVALPEKVEIEPIASSQTDMEASNRTTDAMESDASQSKSGGPASSNEGAPTPATAEQPAQSAQSYVLTLKAHRREAQQKVMELYDLLEVNQSKEALGQFKKDRLFIAENVDPQVFTMLEQTIMHTMMKSQPPSGEGRSASLRDSETSSYSEEAPSPEQERLTRINGFLRDNKVEAAFSEFKRSEKQLKKAMEKNEFKLFKRMIENAYKTRHLN
jgi:hypothetical protein